MHEVPTDHVLQAGDVIRSGGEGEHEGVGLARHDDPIAGVPEDDRTGVGGVVPGADGTPTLLIEGASGGVGLAALQIAVDEGLRVIGTASPAKHDLIARLGGTPVAYGAGVADRVRDVAPQGVDGIFQTSGASTDELLTLVDDPAKMVTIVDFGAGAKGVQVNGGASEWAAALPAVIALAERGHYVLRVGRVFSLDQAGEAQAYSAAGGDGRAVIVP